MIDVKCKGCNKLLAKATIMVAAVKCPRCKMVFEYHIYTNTLHVTNSFDMKRANGIMPPETSRVLPDNRETTPVKGR